MNRVIYAIGETVLDIIFRDGKPVSAIPGGSMLNSAVSLGRAGLRVEFISEYGCDQTGGIIESFLQENKVGTRYIRRYTEGKTALALAFLDRRSNASYSFYTSYPKIRMKDPLPKVNKGDIILFGSIYAITPGIHGKITQWIGKAKTSGALVVYDPNFRKSHLDKLEQARPWIIKNISLADIVRGSDEDFLTIFNLKKADEVRTKIRACGCNNLIITRNSKSVIAWFGDKKFLVNIPPVKPMLSTVGAGDSFNAGIIYALATGGLGNAAAEIEATGTPAKIIDSGISFAAEVCKSLENYISTGFSKSLKS
ncbi:MAG: PfkB family carbohydrate kinase [Bacteroidetes bacterium]|nr:PfkB family carbohydrate kinase [Bacteroidota bacterium]